MEPFLSLLALLLFCGLAAGPLLALIALVRLRRTELRLRALENELARGGRETRRIAGRVGAIESSLASTGPAPPEPTPQAPSIEPAPAGAATSAPARPSPTPAASNLGTPDPTPPATAASPSPGRSAGIEWERWVGIRGAAVLGTLALGLAGLLFFQYSIEHGLISPAMRVALGALVGGGCLAGSFLLRRRGYGFTADGVAGAGVVILYAASWAAHMRYELIPLSASFGLMALVTAACCLLATRYRSQLIAVAGLLGGFATPLLLSGVSDRPIGLFGYLLMLDCGLLFVARRGRWPGLGLLSLAGTVLFEALWIGGRMGPERLFLGMLVLTVFGALFAFAGRLTGHPDDRGPWLWTRLGAVGVPFLFAIHFASRIDLGPHLYPIGILMTLLAAAGGWMARELKQPRIGVAAAAACVAIVGVWLAGHPLTPALAWETVAVMLGISAVFHLLGELDRLRPAGAGSAGAALVSGGGFFVLLLLVSIGGTGPVWPLVAGWAALTALAYRQASLAGRGVLQTWAAAACALGLTSLHVQARGPLVSPAIFLSLLVAGAAGLFFFANGAHGRRPDLRRHAMHAAAAFAAIVLAGLPSGFIRALPALTALGVAAILGAVVAAAATWLRRGAWYATAVGCTLFAQVAWMAASPGLLQNASLATTTFFLASATVCVLCVWPFAAAGRLGSEPAAWRAAALAGLLALFPLGRLFEAVWSDAAIGLLPVALGLLGLGGAWAAPRMLPPEARASRIALVWFSASAAALFALAVPLQFDREWVTVGWALEGLALVLVWYRLDHPGLKYLGLALLGAATLRLVANPWVLSYHPRSGIPVLNWVLYTYLVPAAALLGSALVLRRREVARARGWERGLYAGRRAVGAAAAGLAAIVVVFVWINLAIADVFATGSRLALELGGDPAQRLTVSIAWAVYAVVLLVLGMARDSLGLRWLSLCFLIVTIGKVFLYDLGALRDLYRVASLVGLAVSLILVSLLYQRFVFGTRNRGI